MISESLVDLSRLQFAVVALYHFLFVPLTLGLSWMLVIMEAIYVRTGNEVYRDMTKFWGKLFGINFALGVTTGITMEFQFGTNWAYYSHYVGDIFGAPLAIEGLLAFFLESTFLAIWLFGWDKLPKGLHLASIWLAALGANLSALWILIANSWMHTPAGYRVEGGKAILTSFWAAALNPSIGPRYVHTVVATLIAGCFVVAAVAGYYFLKRRDTAFARQAMTYAVVVGVVLSVAMPFIGHWHALVVAEHQPIKMAAFENVGDTQKNAPLYLFGWVRSDGETVGLAIPSGLSLMLGLSPGHEVTGLNSVAAGDRPPVQIVFQSYHLIDDLTVYENLETPLLYKKVKAAERKSLVADMLDRFGIVAKKDLFPAQLSGGQQQLVAVARAMIIHPRLILADEPTGNLDSKSGQDIIRILHELNQQGNTIMLITHDNAISLEANRRMSIRDGRISLVNGNHDVTRTAEAELEREESAS